MTFILLIVATFWALATLQGVWSLVGGVRFFRYVSAKLREPAPAHAGEPSVTVLLPCCGVDDRLSDTIAALGQQTYRNYEVVFAFESVDDPAYAAIGRWAQSWTGPRWRRVIAGRADHRSQKVHNLLAALEIVSPQREVLVFLDSDAIPQADWLASLIAPLADPAVGAATGFRWYTSNGNLASCVRSAWNAATITFLHDDKFNFCWGGSTAIRRGLFDRLKIAQRWQSALSDDYQVTRAVRDADLRIRFVPRCLLPSPDRTSFRSFLTFARRQLVITRVCAPHIWRAGLVLASNFIVGATAVAGLALYACVNQQYDIMTAALVGWAVILLLAGGKSALRQLAVRKALKYPDVSWRDFAWDVAGVGFIGVLHFGLLLSSARSRRITWRSTEYEMVSADHTVVLGRTDEPVHAAQPAVSLS